MSLADRVVAGDPAAIARALSLIENESADAPALIHGVYRKTGRAVIVGVTGAPGAGKSSLVDGLIGQYRQAGSTVGVLAVDPSSPFSGGAILGDRVRMQAHAEDAGVFIRSMATRGQLGGLARATADAAAVLDAAGFDIVIVETVGVGQAEVDIVRTADVCVVVVAPGGGDEVQALKAGIMEIADLFVVNKADREGADRTAAAIEVMLSLSPAVSPGAWRPPILHTVATTGRGVPEVVKAIEQFRRHEGASGERDRRRERADARLREALISQFLRQLDSRDSGSGDGGPFARAVDAIMRGEVDPGTAAASMLEQARGAIVLDHVGIATEQAGALVTLLADLFGLESGVPEDVGIHRIRFVNTGPAAIELVEPLTPESPIAKFLTKHGPGLHHICLRVHDIDAALTALEARGVRLADTAPRPGAHGARIAFLHPASTQGVLIELKQSPPRT